jgi:hypothetical protein
LVPAVTRHPQRVGIGGASICFAGLAGFGAAEGKARTKARAPARGSVRMKWLVSAIALPTEIARSGRASSNDARVVMKMPPTSGDP